MPILRVSFLVVAATFLQALLVGQFLPVADIFSAEPLMSIDNAAHWYRIETAKSLAATGQIVGYDPFFNAGTEIGIAANPAAKVPALFGVIFQDYLSAQQVWKLYVYVVAVLSITVIASAFVIFQMPMASCIVGIGLAILLFWTSRFQWFFTAGLVSYVFASFLSVFLCSLVSLSFRRQMPWYWWIFVGLISAVGFLIHPLFCLLPAVWTVISLAFLSKTPLNSTSVFGLFVVVPVIALGFNWAWIDATFISEPLTINLIEHGRVPQSFVGFDLIWKDLVGIWDVRNHPSWSYPLILIGAFLGLAYGWRIGSREGAYRVLIIGATAGLFWILYASFGGLFDRVVMMTQPNRFAVAGYLFLTIPAAIGLTLLFSRNVIGESRISWVVMSGLRIVTVMLALFNVNEVLREFSSDPSVSRHGIAGPWVKGVGEDTRKIKEMLERHTQPSARVLFEVSNGRKLDNSHSTAYLAYSSGREFIGGHYPFYYFADFTDGWLFGQLAQDLSTEDFDTYVDRYNIGWSIVYSASAKSLIARFPKVEKVATYGDFDLYRHDRDHSYFIQGSGVRRIARHNEIQLTEISKGAIVLSYHYMRGLVVDPMVEMTKVYLGDDPNPFIQIEDPPKNLTIRFSP